MFSDEAFFWRKEKYLLQRNYPFHKELPPSLSLSKPSQATYAQVYGIDDSLDTRNNGT